MQYKRPILSRGDVCRISKRYKRRFKRNASIVVLRVVRGDGSDRFSVIECSVSLPSRFGEGGFKKPYKHKFTRDQLWFTGYNIESGETNKSRVTRNQRQPRKNEELCHNATCGKMKDKGAPCWWCGTP